MAALLHHQIEASSVHVVSSEAAVHPITCVCVLFLPHVSHSCSCPQLWGTLCISHSWEFCSYPGAFPGCMALLAALELTWGPDTTENHSQGWSCLCSCHSVEREDLIRGNSVKTGVGGQKRLWGSRASHRLGQLQAALLPWPGWVTRMHIGNCFSCGVNSELW